MSKTLLRNNSQSPITLPPPYTGIIAPGDAVVLDDPPSVVSETLGIVPELISFLVVTQVPDAQPTDGHDRVEAAKQIANALTSLTEPLDVNGERIINVGAPTANTDAATKLYVDTAVSAGGNGTVYSVTSGNAYLTVTDSNVNPVITAQVGTGANQLAAATDARFNAAPSTAGAVVYDAGAAYTKTAAGTVGQVLKVGAGGLPEWGADSTAPSGPAGGSLAGNYPNPTIAAGAVTNTEVSATAAIATSKLSGLLTDIASNGLAAFVDAATLPARTYYVAVDGSDLNDGSLSAPFATIQAAHDEAATTYSAGEYVVIEVGAGTFTGNVNITRKNTLIQGQGHRAEMFATTIAGSITVNPLTATSKFTDLVGIAGCFVSVPTSSTAPAVKATGSAIYSLILNDCYLYTNNAASTASALACDATNALRPRIVVNDGILATEQAGPAIAQFDRGDVRFNNTRALHNSGVTSGAAGDGVAVLNNATLWLNSSTVETRTRGSAVVATGASAETKLISTIAGITCAYAGPENTTHGITVGNTTGAAAFVFQTTFSVADGSAGVYAINGSAPAVVVYGELTFQPGTNSAIAPAVTMTAMTEMHANMVLPALSASLPLKLDANKQVTAAAISLSGTEVTNTLPIDKGGTGISTNPTAGGVVYGGATTQAYSAAGTSGQPLLSGGAGAPSFGSLNLATVGNVTGTLPKGNQEAQDVGGDLSGSTAAATVIQLQGRPLAATLPTSGQVIAWSGSSWEPATVTAGGGGGGGGGGLTYYMNYTTAGAAPLPAAGDKQLALAYNTSGQVNTGAITAPQSSYATLAEFVTDLGLPGATTIPPGNWDIGVYLLTSGSNNTYFRARVFKWDGTTLTELSTSPSDDVDISSAGVSPNLFTASVYIAQAVLTATDRIVIRLEITRATPSARTVTGYFNGNTPSHVHTTLGAPGGTGLVKTVDGVVQAPASLLVNADVDAAAAIAVSKLDGNAGSGGANKVLHGSATAGVAPTWSAVALGSDVDGQLPVGNGGTGLSTGTAGGLPYFSAANTMASSSALTTNALVLGGGTSGPATLSSLGTTTKVLHGNASGAPTWDAISLTADVSGKLPIANGGTNGDAVPTAGEVAYGDGSSYAFTTGGTSGYLLKSNGISPPSWLDIVPYTAGGTGSNAVPTANQIPYGNLTSTGLTYTTGGSVGQVLGLGSGGQPEWISNSSSPTGAAGGDLSSNYPNPTVAKINGTTVTTAGGSLLTGSVLRVTGGAAADWGQLDLGSANAVTGTLSSTHLPSDVVYTSGSYSNPSWITSIAGSVVSGNISGNAASITNTLGETKGGTNQTTYAAGDMLYASAADTLSKLTAGVGNNGKVLTVVAGLPAWQDRAAIPYDVAGSIAGQAGPLATVFYFKATRAFTLSATAGDHSFAANTGATSSSVFTVYRNADQIFQATFAAGGSSPQSATIGTVTNNSISVGDVIKVVAPASQDATLADIYWTLTGSVA